MHVFFFFALVALTPAPRTAVPPGEGNYVLAVDSKHRWGCGRRGGVHSVELQLKLRMKRGKARLEADIRRRHFRYTNYVGFGRRGRWLKRPIRRSHGMSNLFQWKGKVRPAGNKLKVVLKGTAGKCSGIMAGRCRPPAKLVFECTPGNVSVLPRRRPQGVAPKKTPKTVSLKVLRCRAPGNAWGLLTHALYKNELLLARAPGIEVVTRRRYSITTTLHRR